MHDYLKNLFVLFLSGLFSIVSEYQHAFIALFVGFLFNIFMGIAADASRRETGSFSLVKAREGLKLFMFYCLTVLAIYGMTYSEPDISSLVIKWLTYVISYFYLVNIFRNAKQVFPGNKSIAFIYLLLSTEVFFILKDFLKIKRTSDKFDDFMKDDDDD